MLSSERILDRGRLLIGIMVVAPLGALAPAIRPPADPVGPAWAITATTPNPLTAAAPSARDVLATLTNHTVSGAGAGPEKRPNAANSPSSTGTDTSRGAAVTPPAIDEVGSEQAAAEQPSSLQIPGTAPDAAVVAGLTASQSPVAPQTPPAESAPPGPMPVATPSVAAYSAPQETTHLFPVVGGAAFTNDWGGTRPGGRSHEGIDLFAATGTPIVAVSDGTLFRVGWNAIGGWRAWLRDRWGNTFYYAHLSAFAPAAREGAAVTAGTVLGFVGTTGDAKATPPHVHFEVHPDGGDSVPPYPLVAAWPRV